LDVITEEPGEPADGAAAPAGGVGAVAAGDPTAAAGAGPKPSRIRFEYAASACVFADPGYCMRLVISDGRDSPGSVRSVRIVRSVMVLAP
jgi:hypothetical protein